MVIKARIANRNIICTMTTDVLNESGILLEFLKTFGIDHSWGRLYRDTDFKIFYLIVAIDKLLGNSS